MKRIYYRLILCWARGIERILTDKVMVKILIRYCRYYAKHGKKVHNAVIWGDSQVTNIKYWSAALKKGGYNSYTLVPYHTSTINNKKDFDFYYDDVIPWRLKNRWFWKVLFCRQTDYYLTKPFWALLHIMKYAKIYHVYFQGGPLSHTKYWKEEAELLKLAGVKLIGTAYGGDIYMYSKIQDLSIRHVMNMAYSQAAIKEKEIEERVQYWTECLDFIPGGFITDGRSRWDLLLSNPICIDTDLWKTKGKHSQNDGTNGAVKIIHLSNHRQYSGTDFIVKAIKELKAEGLKIDFFHPEGRIPNDEFKARLEESDIIVDAIIFTGYGLAAIEAMATGNCAIVNLENIALIQVFRRYSWLNECPLLSASPENIKAQIRLLVTNPELREILAKAGRKYVEKYHSEKNMQYWFGKVHEKLIEGKEVDFSTLYLPTDPTSYNNSSPLIEHPLVENKLPDSYTKKSNPTA